MSTTRYLEGHIHIIAGDSQKTLASLDIIVVNGETVMLMGYDKVTDTYVCSRGFFTEEFDVPADGEWDLADMNRPSYTCKE
jgi:hypothetical protein